MNCEIEFLPVGDASKAGDAVVIRYGNAFDYKLMLVDGGHAETGDKIVSHLRQHFGQRPVLEHVVLTHSDGDHASGLRTVLAQIKVKNLWLHLPWEHASETLHLFADKRWTIDGLRRVLRGEYPIVSEIHDLAEAQGTTINGAFQGQNIGPFHVCSPSIRAYNYLLPQFDRTPEPDQATIEQADMWLGKESLAKRIMEAAKAALQDWTTETWAFERLKDGGRTSASNESSVVLYGAFDNDARVLLTGDTGINGLTWTANYADRVGLPLRQFTFVQVPHHGSRRNVGPTVLNRLVGPILPQGSSSRFSAYISAPANDTKHPRRIVINAFTRRGGLAIATQGNSKIHWGGFPARQGYFNAEPLPFYTEVEEYT